MEEANTHSARGTNAKKLRQMVLLSRTTCHTYPNYQYITHQEIVEHLFLPRPPIKSPTRLKLYWKQQSKRKGHLF